MAKKKSYVEHTKIIDGVKFEFLSWDGGNITFDGKRVAHNSIMLNYAKRIAPIAKKASYARVQIGTIGDFHFANVSLTGRTLTLDTMHLARFLKR